MTIEDGGEHPEVHFHAGGQGVWVAHMGGALGAALPRRITVRELADSTLDSTERP